MCPFWVQPAYKRIGSFCICFKKSATWVYRSSSVLLNYETPCEEKKATWGNTKHQMCKWSPPGHSVPAQLPAKWCWERDLSWFDRHRANSLIPAQIPNPTTWWEQVRGLVHFKDVFTFPTEDTPPCCSHPDRTLPPPLICHWIRVKKLEIA